MGKIAPRTRVRHVKSGHLGTTAPDMSGMLSVTTPEETLVVYDGSRHGTGTLTDDLEVIGQENAVADKSCGVGQGEKCCIFVVVRPDEGFVCERHGPLRDSLLFKNMEAKRNPEEPYPYCRLT